MDPWIVLSGVVVLALLFVAASVGAAAFTYWRRPWRLTCPRAGTEAQIKVAPTGAALAAIVGAGGPAIERCSLWPTVRDCRDQCLALPAGAMRPMLRGTPPPRPDGGPALRTVLVPLDGSPGSEAVLDAVRELTRIGHATVRFIRVVKPVEVVRSDDDRLVLAFKDQETARRELETRQYFKQLAGRLPGVTVEGAVRFGDPVTEIVAEAESAGADVIAMASHRRNAFGRLVKGSVAKRLGRETRIPVLLVPYAERPAA